MPSSNTRYEKITASTSVQDFADADLARTGLYIFNASSDTLIIRIDADATTSDFSFKISPGSFYEMPLNYFTDKVTGLWTGTNGFATVTEISS